MEDIDKKVEAVVSDLKSCDPFTENVCGFISNCVLETLSNPLKVKDLNGFNFQELIHIKKKADEDIRKNLKKNFNIDCDVSQVVSVFENASFFDEVLSSLSGFKELCVDEPKGDSEFDNKTIHLDNPVLDKIYDKECNMQTGHVDLDVEAFRRSKNMFNKNKKLVSNHKDYVDRNSFQPVIKPPLTKSKFKLINVNGFLSLSSFCECCKQRLKKLDKHYTSNNLEIKCQNSFVIHSESSLFKPLKKITKVTEEVIGKVTVSSLLSSAQGSTLELSESESVKTKDLDLDTNSTESHNETNAPDSLQVRLEGSSKKLKINSLVAKCNQTTILEESVDKKLLETPKSLFNTKVEQVKCDVPPNNNTINQIIKKTDIVTSKQILDAIYCKHNEKKNKLDMLEQPNKSVKKNVQVISKGEQNQKTVSNNPLNKLAQGENKRLIIPSEQRTVKQEKFVVYENKIKASDISPVLPPNTKQVLNKNLDHFENIPSKTLVNDPLELIAPCTLKKTITNQELDSDELLDEYIPLVVLDNMSQEENIDTVKSKGKLLLDGKRRKAIKKLAKLLKKEKTKKRKRNGKKLEIDLEPPPGVDLNVFLQQQIDIIKLNLNACDGSKSLDQEDLPDLIKDQIGADTSRNYFNNQPGLSISAVQSCSTVDLNRRKVIPMKEASKLDFGPKLLEEGEIVENSLDNEYFKDNYYSHGNQQESKYNQKGVCYPSYELEKDTNKSSVSKDHDRGLVGHSPHVTSSLISVSDDEISLKDNMECVIADNNRSERRRSSDRLPLNYLRHRFGSRSKSPPVKRCRRYSRSPRRSPCNRYNRSHFRRRSRSISPRRRSYRKRSRSHSPRFSSNRRRYGKSKSPSKESRKYSRTDSKGETHHSSVEKRIHSSRSRRETLKETLSDHSKKDSSSDNIRQNSLKIIPSVKANDPAYLNLSPISDRSLNLSGTTRNQYDIYSSNASPISEGELFEQIETVTTVIETRTTYN